jgi:transcriptional regulator with XRE-family HTH domain
MTVAQQSQALCARILKLLREEREARSLTKYVVAKRSGLSQQAIGYMERGEKRPSLETILRYTAAIEVNFADILNRAQEDLAAKRRK